MFVAVIEGKGEGGDSYSNYFYEIRADLIAFAVAGVLSCGVRISWVDTGLLVFPAGDTAV